MYKTGVPLEERQILKLFVSVCKGLNAMHTCSAGPLAHNDIKVRIETEVTDSISEWTV